jgi:hypothetical protein
MGTIYIHYHVQDRFAAEVIAGTIVDCGEVALCPHHPLGEPRVTAERFGVDWHVVLWTPQGASHPAIATLVGDLARCRGPLMVLTYDDSFAPHDVRAEHQFPLFDRAVEWSVYRAGLRQRLHYAEATYPNDRNQDPRLKMARRFERAVYQCLSNTYVTPALILCGVFVWTLAR